MTVPRGRDFASREHRIMSVSITWGQRDQVQTIAEAVGAAVQDGGADYFPQLAGVEAKAVLIDGPGIGQSGRSLKDQLDLPIRLFVALVAGVALAFLWDYLDDTVRGRAEMESIGTCPCWARSRRADRARGRDYGGQKWSHASLIARLRIWVLTSFVIQFPDSDVESSLEASSGIS